MRCKKLRDSARGENCTFQILGVCRNNTETTVLCHLPSPTGGMGLKSSDECAAFGCYDCHQVIDGHVQCEEYSKRPDWYENKAIKATIHRWTEMRHFWPAGAK